MPAVVARTSGDFVKAGEGKVEITQDGGTSWEDVSSFGIAISSSSTAVEATTFKLLDGTSETVDAGGDPTETITVTMIFVKQEGSDLHSVLFDTARASDKSLDIRWSRAGTSGESMFTSTSGKVTSCPPPPFDAASTDVVRVDAVIEAASVARSVIA